MKTKIKSTEKFCHSILQLEIEKSKALANAVMGLASQTFAQSIVEISLSRCYHYQYSSIGKVMDSLFCKERSKPGEEVKDRLESEKKFRH